MHYFRTILLPIGLLWLCACSSPPKQSLADYRPIDLTYTFDEKTIYWPTGKHFEHERVSWGRTQVGYWYSSYNLAGSEHGGTHLDAPIHFAEGKRVVSDIPLSQLIVPAVVVDISAQCESDPDYQLSVNDLEAHERQHGAIQEGTGILVHTGWGRFWPDVKSYLGNDVPGDTENLHFPGVSEQAAEALVQKGIAVVGIDTASIDHGPSRDFKAHQVFAAAQIACLENVARLDQAPATGAFLFALPMKIGEGSGAPCRIVALVRR